MSLINKMLQDLESRQNPRVEANKKSVFEDLKPVPASWPRVSSRRLPVVFLALVLIGGGVFGWMQWSDRLFPAATAPLAKPRPMAVRAAPPTKPAPAPVTVSAPAVQAPATPVPVVVTQTVPAPPTTPVQNQMNETSAGNASAMKPAKEPIRTAVPEKAPTSAGKRAALTDAGYWTVSAGDTLYGISSTTGVDLWDLSRWNHLGREHVIHPGQRLRLTPPEANQTKRTAGPAKEKKSGEPKPIRVASAAKPRVKDDGPKALPSSEANATDSGVMDKKIKPLSSDEQAEGEYRQAVNLLQKGRAGDAERHLKSALQISAEHTPSRELLAGLQLQTGHWREAEETLEQGLAKAPAYYPFAQLLARTYLDHGSEQKALTVMETSRQAGARSPEFMALLAALHQRAGNYAEAIKAYTDALKLDPQEGRSWLGLGISLEAIQDRNAAAAAYQRAVETGRLDDNLLRYARQRLAVVKNK